MQLRPGQVKIVSHVRQKLNDVEADFPFTQAARWKFFTSDGDDFARCAVFEVNCSIDAGGWHRFSRFVRATLAISGRLHANCNLPRSLRVAGCRLDGGVLKGRSVLISIQFCRRLLFAFGFDLRGNRLDIFQRDVLYPESDLLRG